jgi:ankyrin repeat protein
MEAGISTTLLSKCALLDHAEMAALFLEYGADPSVTGSSGLTSAQVAESKQSKNVLAVINAHEARIRLRKPFDAVEKKKTKKEKK